MGSDQVSLQISLIDETNDKGTRQAEYVGGFLGSQFGVAGKEVDRRSRGQVVQQPPDSTPGFSWQCDFGAADGEGTSAVSSRPDTARRSSSSRSKASTRKSVPSVRQTFTGTNSRLAPGSGPFPMSRRHQQ